VEAQDGVEADRAAGMRRASWILCSISSILLGLQIIMLFLYAFRPADLSQLYRLPDVWAPIFVTVGCGPLGNVV
jgi:hypothetical protein